MKKTSGKKEGRHPPILEVIAGCTLALFILLLGSAINDITGVSGFNLWATVDPSTVLYLSIASSISLGYYMGEAFKKSDNRFSWFVSGVLLTFVAVSGYFWITNVQLTIILLEITAFLSFLLIQMTGVLKSKMKLGKIFDFVSTDVSWAVNAVNVLVAYVRSPAGILMAQIKAGEVDAGLVLVSIGFLGAVIGIIVYVLAKRLWGSQGFSLM